MTAKEAISPYRHLAAMAGEQSVMGSVGPRRTVSADEQLVDVLPKLLDAPSRELRVADGDRELGVIDTRSMLEALGRMIAARDDASTLTVECPPSDYSASAIARAVDDVVETSARPTGSATVEEERLSALQVYLNV